MNDDNFHQVIADFAARSAQHVRHACPSHGEYVGFSANSECPNCKAESESQHEALLDRWRTFRRFQSAGLPPRLADKCRTGWRPESATDRSILAALNAYADNISANAAEGKGLLLLGGPGLGKSHLLAALVGDAIEAGARDAQYHVWPELIATHRHHQNEPDSPIYAAMQSDFLCLDELGATPPTEWQAAELFRLIDHRYREKLPTVAASNLTASQLPGAIGERAADRLRESCLWLHLSGESRRGKANLPPDRKRFEEPQRSAVASIWCGTDGWCEKTMRV